MSDPASQQPPTIITPSVLADEFDDLVATKKKQPTRRRWLFLVLLIAISILAWAAWRFSWFTPPEAMPIATADSLATAPPTSSKPAATDNLATPEGRDAVRLERLELFIAAAQAARRSNIALPVTTTPVRLNDAGSQVVEELTSLLLDQGLSITDVATYFTDPSPASYYFGYSYDGQTLSLTAVMESGGDDCAVTQTQTGSICILTKSTSL